MNRFYQDQIEAMQRLLERPQANMTTFTDQEQSQANVAQVQPERHMMILNMTD